MIFNICVELFYKMSPRMTRTQIPKFPNWYFAENTFPVALLRDTIFFRLNSPTHICVHCGQLSALLPDTPGFFPQCKCCETKALIKKIKWKQLIKLDLSSKKKTEKAIGYYIRYYIRYYICYSWVYILI